MPYCTQADILLSLPADQLLALTDDAGVGTVDSTIVARAIAVADAEIDSYAGRRYSVPFDPVQDVIRDTSTDLAIYNLYSRRRGAPEDRKARYDNRIRFLRDVAKGVASLGEDDPDGNPKSSSESQIVVVSGDSIFSRSSGR